MSKFGTTEDNESAPELTRQYLRHTIEMIGWAKVDPSVPEEVRGRALEYFKHCESNGMRPTVEGLAFAFDMNRENLQRYAQGAVQGIPQGSIEWFRRAYDIVSTQLADYMYNNKINTVAGIFLMKNNMAYKDETIQYVQNADSLGQLTSQDELIRRITGGVASDYVNDGTGSAHEVDSQDQTSTVKYRPEQSVTERDHTDWEIDGSTPEAFMDLLEEAETGKE